MKKLLALCAVLAVALAGCDKPAGQSAPMSFQNTDVTGLPYGQDFALTDHNGKARTLADFKGKVVIMFFGFTQCPDVCPTALAEMAAMMQQLGAQSDQVQVLLVTVDPERDTQALLAQYVTAFDKRFLGLYGDAAATARVAKEFKVHYAKAPGKDAANYSMDHTAASYVFDRAGKVRLFVRAGQGVAPIVHDVKQLLD